MKKIFFILSCILLGVLMGGQVQWYFNMTVSPIKYEIEAQQWDIVVKSATLYNYSDQALHIKTSTAEFISDGSSGQPKIVPAQWENSISHWITLHTQDFYIEPNSQKSITFDIFIPDDATPGGHYGAVFFENDAWVDQLSSWVWVNVDYGVLLLVNVDGEIVKKAEVDEIKVTWWASKSFFDDENINKNDSCIFGDFSRSNFDGKCIDDFTQEDEIDPLEINDIWDKDTQSQDNLDIKIVIPFENQWNTHIKPDGKIILTDEEGKQIKWIWKEVILNENGAIIGEKIVDYLPINDIGWNVLPQTTRIFQGEWKWFPYKTYDELWNQVIKYAHPSEFYAQKNIAQNRVLKFWERVLQRKQEKTVTAQIEVSYKDIDGEEVEFNSAQEFTIEYVDTYIWLNKYLLSILWFVLCLWSFLYILGYIKKRSCKKCGKKIKKHLKACPYCGKKQKDKDVKEKKKKKKS